MKKSLLFVIIFSIVTGIVNAKSLIQCAINDDIENFKLLLKKKSNLDEISEKNMNLQVSLAYFSDENFATACSLLEKKKFDFDKPTKSGITLLYTLAYSLQANKIETLLNYKVDVNKKVNDITPIQATQFSTYKFYTKQEVNQNNFVKAKHIQNLLEKSGSEKFKYLSPNLYYFGNFLYCTAFSIYQFNPLATPYDLNQGDYFDIAIENQRQIASLKFEMLKDAFLKFDLDAEFTIVRGTESIIKKIQESNDDPDYPYLIMAFTENNKIAPYQWVLLDDIKCEKNLVCENDYFNCLNSDMLFAFMDFQVKDLSEIILIKIKNR